MLRPRGAHRRQQGMALVVARESNHFGAAAWWAQKMRARGRSESYSARLADRAPGRAGRAGGHQPDFDVGARPWLLDMATTTVRRAASSKRSQRAAGDSSGLGVHSEGVPTTDTAEAYKGMLMRWALQRQRPGHDGGDSVRVLGGGPCPMRWAAFASAARRCG